MDIGTGFIGELGGHDIAVLGARGADEDLELVEIITIRDEFLGEGLSGVDLLNLALVEGARLGKCDERGESEEYQENGYPEECKENIF